MLTIVHGKALAKKMTESLVKARGQFSITPGLGIVCVAGDGPSSKYLKAKEKAAKELNIYTRVFKLENNATTDEVLKAIHKLDIDADIDGIVVELPLPKHIDRAKVLASVPALKDVDVISPDARARFAHEEFFILPPIVSAVQYILEAHNIALLGKEALVLGHGLLVGAPLAQFMRQCGARVTVLDRPVRDLNEFTRDAQIIICGTGSPHVLKPENVHEGVIIIDAGMYLEDNNILGDSHPDVAIHSALFTPTPGGVGPLVVSSLMKNVLLLSRSRNQ